MVKYYQIAGIRIKVSIPDEAAKSSDGILENFVSDSQTYTISMDFKVVETLSMPVGKCILSEMGKRIYEKEDKQIQYIGAVENSLDHAYVRICKEGSHSEVEVKRASLVEGISNKTILNAMGIESLIIKEKGFILHASYINWNGEGILFTAPSGTGKSTQAELWCSLRGAELINGDRAVIKKETGGFNVYGIPFSGSSGVRKNITLPLKAIVCLAQAPVTKITRLKGARAFRNIWEGCSVNSWNRDEVECCMETVSQMIEKVPVFHLACTPDESAVKALENALKEWSDMSG